MAQQYSAHLSYLPSNSKLGTRLMYFAPNWQAIDMTRNESHDSAYFSTASENCDNAYYQTPSPAAMSFVNWPPVCYGNDQVSAQQCVNPQYLESSPSGATNKPERESSPRETPSSLGWTRDEKLFKPFYKFVIPKGKPPYFQLLGDRYFAPCTPEKVFLDSPRDYTKSKDTEFPCMFPGACEGTFKRPADLERHYRNVHGDSDQKDQYICDYAPCRTIRNPFTRKDHFRDHLRDYHKEDIGATKKDKKNDMRGDAKTWQNLQAIWIVERNIVGTWWRCPKCLQRVSIADFGYECQPCKYTCDRERVDRIEAARAEAEHVKTAQKKPSNSGPVASNNAKKEEAGYAYTSASLEPLVATYHPNCCTCGGTEMIWNTHSVAYVPCQACQPPLEQEYMSGCPWGNGVAGYANGQRYWRDHRSTNQRQDLATRS